MIVVSPTDSWVRLAFAEARKAIRVSSPYVGGYLRDRIFEVREDVDVVLLTRTLITDFASKASDYDAVCSIAERTGGVLSLASLHAKVYIVDQNRGLITSANATYSGMYRNTECGVEIKGRKQVTELLVYFSDAFGRRPSLQPWTLSDLQTLREPIEVLASSIKRIKVPASVADDARQFEIDRRGFDRLLESFSGWLRLTLDGVARLNKSSFTVHDVYSVCQPLVAAQFPANQHPRPKIRQQLQRLRDLGIIQFLGDGRYELLAQRRD